VTQASPLHQKGGKDGKDVFLPHEARGGGGKATAA
jgi:hypothetical protein